MRFARWPFLSAAAALQIAVIAVVAAIALFFLLNRIAIVPIETDVLRQVLLTVGFAFLFQQAALDIWGGDNMDINPAPALRRASSSAACIFRSIAYS